MPDSPTINLAEIEEIISLGSSSFSADELSAVFDSDVWLVLRQNLMGEFDGLVKTIAEKELNYRDFLTVQARLKLLYGVLQMPKKFSQVSKAATFMAKEQHGIEQYQHPKDQSRMSRLRELLNSGRWIWKLK
jgi:hypothetical protein